MFTQRLNSLRALLVEQQLDALLFFGMPDIRYHCGFTGSDGVLLIRPDETVFLSDSRYQQQAHEQVTADRIVCYQMKIAALAEELEQEAIRRVGFDAARVTVAQFDDLREQASAGIEWCPLRTCLEGLRALKSPEELQFLQAAADLNHSAFDQVLPRIAPGITERQIALELEMAMKQQGGEVNAFDFIVASGVRGALPHGIASDKPLASGELVTIDFGTRINGYHSDETVTLALGEVDGNLRQIFDIVLEAHDAALEAVAPDVPIADLDAVARDLIRTRGFGEYFGHGLGHGVGLEVHEFPALNSRSTGTLRSGMVVTIEPGIYLPDVGGVRIEDTVVVTDSGYRSLTSIPKGFRRL